ncbi:multidrug efflux RND transporter periplasmic adaptor subunit SmeD [Stenotrophomonas tumulicola]|uniref:Multidrug efflux RND transporter periplasmic adaptor subunit SmeD n=1 Tax=Stenotrophomonas tumulicola TaxID=1685415 RepID=A0A7W3IHU0_9GAMM|nr:multidrug efflux RND transporter periplasmic adaptor subunit SmeD [Stenotrophomonas tumulicola]MBA8681561.1 multidrug efflux RND transporter periplasmic adaptor subunit SmeD [Stenotrophomonas tumulicola]
MFLTRVRPFALSLAIATAVAACGGGDQQPEQGPGQVTVVTLKAESVSLTRELPGRTNAFLVAEVRPQVNGIVAKRLFTEGTMVQAGQPLYQIDDASYRAQANNARAQLARAEATANASRLSAKRITELAKVDAVSQQDLENAVAAQKQAEADVGAGKASLDAANVTLGYARITAPISGRIGKSSVTQGALVSAAQADALATVQQLDPIYVDLTQSAAELLQLRRELAAGRLQDNQSLPVDILLDDGSTFGHKGTLEFSEVSVDPSTGSYGLRVKVDNPDGVLMPGMYVRAVIGGGVRNGALLVPMQGIARDAKGDTSAMVVNKDGKVEVRPVKVSRALGDKWLVEDGLQAGDKVIVEGLQKIAPDMPVQAVEKGTEPAQPAAAGDAPAGPSAATPAEQADAAPAQAPADANADAQ